MTKKLHLVAVTVRIAPPPRQTTKIARHKKSAIGYQKKNSSLTNIIQKEAAPCSLFCVVMAYSPAAL